MSYSDKRIGRRIPAFVRREDTPGVRFDSGPYVGKIVNNLDTLRAGRLEVWIPDLGGKEDDPHSWRTVHYASPFFGSSNQEDSGQGPNEKNEFKSVKHTYGMWFTPPDVGNFVICTFIAGDPMRGFWFACIPNQLGQHMVPAIAGSKNVDSSNIQDSAAKEIYESGNPYPVVEFNENGENASDLENFTQKKKPIHEYQVKILGEQGLDKDQVRGIITSSSQRESPSAVFGISTPGRPLEEKSAPSDASGEGEGSDIKTKDLEVYGRRGGHSFVMDDGDYQGKNQLMRFRTASGHQIMLHDSEETIYISNSTGKVWLEMTGKGNLHVYSEESVSFRSKKGFNFHTEKDFIVQADGNIQFKAKKAFNVESESTTFASSKKTTIFGAGDVEIGSQGKINLHARNSGSFLTGSELVLHGSKIRLNSGKGPEVKKPKEIKTNKFPDAEKSGNKWKSKPNKIKSIVKIVPTHEPWPRPPNKKSSAAAGAAGGGTTDGAQQVSASGVNPSGAPNSRLPGIPAAGNAGINQAVAQGVRGGVSSNYLDRYDNPTPSSGVGPLSADEVKALKTQIGYSESGFKYDIAGGAGGNYLGKYQFGAGALADQKYIKDDAYRLYGNAAVNYPSSWTGKDGINSKEAFLSNGSVQEKAMEVNLQTNYNRLLRNGGISASDDPSTVAGMLSVSHLIGAGGYDKKGNPVGAFGWRTTGFGQDAFGTTGEKYFNLGRYSQNVLAKRG